MKIGALIQLRSTTDIRKKFLELKDIGLESCQVCIWDTSLYTEEAAGKIVNSAADTGIEISTLWAGWRGPASWNFYEGQYNLGLVPDEYRAARLDDLYAAAEFAKLIGVENLATHIGFLPENPSDERYIKTVFALKALCLRLKGYNINFLFETGQETPVTLLRAIEDIGTGNAYINFDTGNLILYGKANPIDALDIVGGYIKDVHVKDGFYPTNGRNLGREVRVGDGKVNFAEFLPRLKNLGYDGSLTIEREITGSEQTRDIIYARDLIKRYWK